MGPLLWYASEVLYMSRIRPYLFVLVLIMLVALALTYPAVLRLGDGPALPGLRGFDEFECAWLRRALRT